MLLRRSLRPATVPLYATYLFADVDQGPPWQAIRRQPGVVSIVMTGDAPSRCPESEILKLKAAEVDGVVRLASAPAPSRYRPSVGEQVRIRFGPLDGREGRYAGPRRNLAQVLVTLLGRQVVVLVAADAIEAKSRLKNHEVIVVASMGKHWLPVEHLKSIDKIRRQEMKSPSRKPETTRRRHKAHARTRRAKETV